MLLRLLLIASACLLLLPGIGLAGEDLLEILRDNKSITQDQYQALKKKRVKQHALDKGLKFESRDGDFQFRIGGRLMMDGAYYENADRELGSGTKVRRARIFVAGKLYKNWGFKGQYDFANNAVAVKDALIRYYGIEKTVLKFGNFKMAFSLEDQTSSKYIIFMERGLPNVFAPGRGIGIGFKTYGSNWTLEASGSGEGPGDTRTNDEGFGFGGRLTFSPIHEANRAVHVGVAVALRVPESSHSISFDSKPESDVTTVNLVNTGIIPGVDHFTNIGLEAALVLGSLSLQGEYMLSFVNRDQNHPDPIFDGFYVSATWFLTGESRNYGFKNGFFGRIKPQKNAGEGGIGAWEVGFRFSHLDLNDGAITGGEENNITLALNWYANPNIRFMVNYIHIDTDPNAGNEDSSVVQLRGQIDF